MSVTERLMKPGQFTVRLNPNAPASVFAAVEKFDHIVITPTRLANFSGFSDANILAQAMYTGVVTAKPDVTELSGRGLGFWLGTDEGLGDLLDVKVSNTAATLSTWVTSLRPASLSAGTVTNTGTNLTYDYQYVSRREALDHACRAMGAEYRINPAFTLDAAAPATLFANYTTPKAVITRKPGGPQGTLTGIQAADVIRGTDVLGYTTKVIVLGKSGDGKQIASGSATQATSYKDGLNGSVVMERFVNAPLEPAANVANYAQSVLNLFSATQRSSLTLTSDTYAASLRVKVGDRVYVYDQRAGLTDSANQLNWRGELITPVILRCKAMTWPILRNYGVYARRSGATPVYTDLSDWVLYEDGATTEWQVGTSNADVDQDPEQLSPAYLGTNPDGLLRATIGQRISYTPTWSGTLGNGTLTGSYQIIGDWCRCVISLTWGTTTTHGAAIQTFSIPSGLTNAATEGCWLGGVRLIDTGVANYGRGVYKSGTNVVGMSEAGAFVSNTVPWTMANTDQQLYEFQFPI